MKKLISYVCVIALAISLLPTNAIITSAVDTNSKCGDNLTWQYNDTELTISGSGAMYDYTEEAPAPWSEYTQTIQRIIIEDGVTAIGNFAFANCSSLLYALIPASVVSVGSKSFSSCKNTQAIDLYYCGSAPSIAEDSFYNSVICNIMIFHWSQSVQKDYGGQTYWRKATVELSENTNRLVALNKELTVDDFIFEIYAGEDNPRVSYRPQQFSIENYDNSTYGEKTIQIRADGYNRGFTYFVTDGSNHLDLITIQTNQLSGYTGYEGSARFVLSMGSLSLKENTDYELIYQNKPLIGTDGQVTIRGKGMCEGFEKTFYYPVLKYNIAAATVQCSSKQDFIGMPVTPTVSVVTKTRTLVAGTDYQVFYENNVNVGTATVRVVGIGNYYGEQTKTFRIVAENPAPTLQGNDLGNINDGLSDDIATKQMIMAPCKFRAFVNYTGMHRAYYSLYRVDEESLTLIEEVETDAGYKSNTFYEYDFSFIYENSKENGGEVYALYYSWITATNHVYGGVLLLIIPAKVENATSMTMYQMQNTSDYNAEYLTVAGDDGALGEVLWISSDESIALVKNGTVTFKKPGSAIITAQCGDLAISHTVTATAIEITQGIIYNFSEQTGKAQVIYNDRLLTEGTDYNLSVERNGDTVTVTATGCGLFTGQLVKTFGNTDLFADPHTHSFSQICDETCNSCELTRDTEHSFTESWSKDQINHWHACTVCGEKQDEAAHSISPDNDEECTVCGRLWIPGDIDGNGVVEQDDAVYLLLHTMFGEEFYPVAMDADIDKDGAVTQEDAVYLLLHTMFGEAFYPLN